MTRYACFFSKNLLTILGICLLAGCSKKPKPREEPVRPVKYQKLEYTKTNASRAYVGISEADKEVRLSFQVNGEISQILVKKGDRVTKGQPLATLNSEDLQLKLDQAVSSENRAKVKFRTASSELSRIRGLYEKNSVSLSDYEKAKSSYAAAKSSYQESLKNVDLANRKLAYTKLRAPISGIVSSKKANINEFVQAGTTVLVVSTERKIQVRVGLPSNFIGKVSSRQPVRIRFSSIPGKTFSGEIQEISYAKSSRSSTYPVKVSIENPVSSLRPGMSAEVTFLSKAGSLEKQLFLPPDAVFIDQSGKSSVYTIELENKNSRMGILKKKEVQIGELTDQGFVLKSGVDAGELIATAGVANLRDQLPVTLFKETNP
ncbi:MAG: efflux RND transporter periplasmic adaptor subunit [Cytophagales bacterium]|nr:efflux RND transporter periplasmic adaptor subunit [Cytophagales bacterium]